MSIKKKAMTKVEYLAALSDPSTFLKQHLTDPSISLVEVSEVTGVPRNTIKGHLVGRRPGLSIVTASALLRYVLWQRGETTGMGGRNGTRKN